MDIGRMIANVQAVQLDKVVEQSIRNTSEHIVKEQRQQWMEGKMSTGDIAPSYFDDPYFKTREAAVRYSNWKDKITPNPKRKKGTPNLFITGKFHGSTSAFVGSKSVNMNASFLGPEITNKYGDRIWGLNPEHTGNYTISHLQPEAVKIIKSKVLK